MSIHDDDDGGGGDGDDDDEDDDDADGGGGGGAGAGGDDEYTRTTTAPQMAHNCPIFFESFALRLHFGIHHPTYTWANTIPKGSTF